MSFELSYIKKLMKSLFLEDFLVKTVFSIFIIIVSDIWQIHQVILVLIFILYFVDLILGIIGAIKTYTLNAKRLMKSASKLCVYGILILVGFALDKSLYTGSLIASMMMAFIISRDSISILNKLYLLGYKTPIWLQLLLRSHKEAMLKEKIRNALGFVNNPFDELKEMYLQDMQDLLTLYLPQISNKHLRTLLEIEVEVWIDVINEWCEKEKNNKLILTSKFDMSVNCAENEIFRRANSAKIPAQVMESFSTLHNPKILHLKNEVRDYITSNKEDGSITEQIARFIVALLYNTVGDTIKSQKLLTV